MLPNMSGQHWKNIRALLTPTFSSGKLKAMENLVQQCGQRMETFLEIESKQSSPSVAITLLLIKLLRNLFLNNDSNCNVTGNVHIT
jgi:cytochrome P450